MKIQHGIDISSVHRMKQAMIRGGRRFCERIFTPGEIEYCESKKMKYEHYAARFAAKEAALKAFSADAKKTSLTEIEVCRQATGKPYLLFSTALRKKHKLVKSTQVELSIAHEREYAIASVVIVW